jgi:hypothetical protein
MISPVARMASSGVGEAVLHQQRGAHRLEDQERGRAEGGVGHAPFAPLAEARARREAQRVVLHRLARDPAVVVAPGLDDALHKALQLGVGQVVALSDWQPHA